MEDASAFRNLSRRGRFIPLDRDAELDVLQSPPLLEAVDVLEVLHSADPSATDLLSQADRFLFLTIHLG